MCLKCGLNFKPIDLNDHSELNLFKFDTSFASCKKELLEDYRAVRERLVGLVRQKKILRRSELNIYFGEWPIDAEHMPLLEAALGD